MDDEKKCDKCEFKEWEKVMWFLTMTVAFWCVAVILGATVS